MPVLPIILILLIILALCGTIFFALNQNAKQKQRILETIQGKRVSSNLGSDKDDQNKRRAAMAEKLKDSKSEDAVDSDKKRTPISTMLIQAGLTISAKQYFLFSALFTCLMFGLLKVIGVSPLMLGLGTVIAFFGIPRMIVKRQIGKRQKAFLEDFPDALEASVRLLKAGMPVSEAILMISKEFTGPAGEEMSRIYDQQKIGVPLHEAAQAAVKRIPLPEMQMFATGLAIQAQTGASLSEVLMNLSGVIRARFRLKRKVKALSSEAIASASIIGALPLLVTAGLYFSNREYIEILFTDSFGQVLLTGAIIWMCLGMLVMKIMINFKV